ncbi:MAG: hypothetical protein DMG71_14050 [Acidobacteria bacterium]|nr:MAG: hypothetical protein DMG71_14050 [Acidobacteriota bacterium]
MGRRVLVSVAAATLGLILASAAWSQSSAFAVAQARAQETAPLEKDEVAAMRSDLQKMRGLLHQMQTNLAFVQNTTTPLKHQFELEIDMWQVLLNQMERRVASMEGPTQKSGAER